jgi:hypothetical protein
LPVLYVLALQLTRLLSQPKTVHVAKLMVSNAPNAMTKSTPSAANSATGPTSVFAAKHAAAVAKNVIDALTGPTANLNAKLMSANVMSTPVLHQNTTNVHAIETLPTLTTSKADSAALMTPTTAENVKSTAIVAVPTNPTYSESAVLPAARVLAWLPLFSNGLTVTKTEATKSKNATPKLTVQFDMTVANVHRTTATTSKLKNVSSEMQPPVEHAQPTFVDHSANGLIMITAV